MSFKWARPRFDARLLFPLPGLRSRYRILRLWRKRIAAERSKAATSLSSRRDIFFSPLRSNIFAPIPPVIRFCSFSHLIILCSIVSYKRSITSILTNRIRTHVRRSTFVDLQSEIAISTLTNKIVDFVWRHCGTSTHFNNVGVFNSRKNPSFDSHIDTSLNKHACILDNLLTENLESVAGVTAFSDAVIWNEFARFRLSFIDWRIKPIDNIQIRMTKIEMVDFETAICLFTFRIRSQTTGRPWFHATNRWTAKAAAAIGIEPSHLVDSAESTFSQNFAKLDFFVRELGERILFDFQQRKNTMHHSVCEILPGFNLFDKIWEMMELPTYRRIDNLGVFKHLVNSFFCKVRASLAKPFLLWDGSSHGQI